MADVFLEHMIKQRLTPKHLIFRILGVLGGLILGLFPLWILIIIPINLLSSLPVTIAAAVWFNLLLFRRTNLEFEYIVTNGEMDVDRIIGRRSRKRLLTIDCRAFDILAPYTPEYAKEHQSQSITKKIDASTAVPTAARYFAVFNDKSGTRTLLLFEPNQRMLDVFQSYIPRKIKKGG